MILRRQLPRGAGLLAALLLSGISIHDPDLSWHLSAARQLLATRSFLRTDFLSWTFAGRPWIDFEWGSELAFYFLHALGGTAALWIFRAAAFFGLTLVFLGLLRLWRIPRTWDALLAPAFAVSLFPIYGMRPEIFSLALFLFQFHILERRRLGRWKMTNARFWLLHGALYALWANLHAGFVAGLLLCVCYGVGELFSRPEEKVPQPFYAATAGLVGTLLTPYGVKLYFVLFEHFRQIGFLRRLIEEWKVPTFALGYLNGYWLMILFSFSSLLWAAFRGGRVIPEHVAVVAVFTLFGARSIRTIPYMILTIFPLGIQAFRSLRPSAFARRCVGIVAAAAIPLAAWHAYSWSAHRRFFGWPEPVAEQGVAKAVDFLVREKATLGGLRLFNPYNWGGYLGYMLTPDYRVFIDGRYLFADLLVEVDAAQNSPDAFRSLINDMGADLAVVVNDGLMMRPKTSEIGVGPRPYLAYAWPRVDWALVYWDSDAAVFVRRSRVPKRWLTKNEYRRIRPHDLHQLGLYVVAGFIPMKDVRAEIERYRREIGDPYEVAQLTAWYERFGRGLPSSRRR